MKKILISLMAAVLAMPTMFAQQEESVEVIEVIAEEDVTPVPSAEKQAKAKAANTDFTGIWKQKKFWKLSYNIAQTQAEGSPVEKAKFGFGLTSGRTWLFPKQPVADMLKFGFDVNFVDLQVAKFGSPNSGFNMPEDDDDDDGGLLGKFSNLGRWSLQAGILGIGPNVSIAPFSRMNNASRFFKASIYFHYQPTLGIYLMSEDGDVDASFAYCNIFQFGGQISWKFIGIGIEGNWGSGKFKPIMAEFADDLFDDGGLREELGMQSFSGKIKRKFANTRLFISFTF